MTVSEFAVEMKVSDAEVKKFLGKKSGDADLSEEEVEKAFGHFNSKEDPKEQKKDDGKVVLFWSEVANHSFPLGTDGDLIRFDKYRLAVEKGSLADKAVRAAKDPDVRIVEDGGFESIRDAKNFRELLNSKVFTGTQSEVSMVRGLSFLYALFKKSEMEQVARLMTEDGAGAVIELAIRTKHYVGM